MKVRLTMGAPVGVAIAALVAVVVLPACGNPDAFQPVAHGARPWSPPPGWDPEPTCATGYFIAIDSCSGCSGISYALCDGISFTQCTCGGPFWPGALCPQTFVCSSNDFPPNYWLEFTDYAGPGWAGLDKQPGGGDGG
jgi:hypothetical protein